jgi:hypothetical protein
MWSTRWRCPHFDRDQTATVITIDRKLQMRCRIERDCLELKQEVGLGHREGRGWRGFHHHASLCIAAYGFLVSEKETIPPRDLLGPGAARDLPFPTVTHPEALPLRSQRPMPNSIATLRIRIGRTWFMSCNDAHTPGRRGNGRSSRLSDAVGLTRSQAFA